MQHSVSLCKAVCSDLNQLPHSIPITITHCQLSLADPCTPVHRNVHCSRSLFCPSVHTTTHSEYRTVKALIQVRCRACTLVPGQVLFWFSENSGENKSEAFASAFFSAWATRGNLKLWIHTRETVASRSQDAFSCNDIYHGQWWHCNIQSVCPICTNLYQSARLWTAATNLYDSERDFWKCVWIVGFRCSDLYRLVKNLCGQRKNLNTLTLC